MIEDFLLLTHIGVIHSKNRWIDRILADFALVLFSKIFDANVRMAQ